MSLSIDGFLHLASAVKPGLADWRLLSQKHFARGRPGKRISADAALAEKIEGLLALQDVYNAIGIGGRCVRAIAFNKSSQTNWGLGWHQDRTIAVRQKQVVQGFDVWTTKDGVTHVEPPFEVLQDMVTLRIHLDDTDETNGALLVAPGSQRLGRIPEERIERVIDACGTKANHAKAGDVWAYSTPILHASGPNAGTKERRVLHLDIAWGELPKPLKWHGIG